MRRSSLSLALIGFVIATLAASTAFAGGPLIINPDTRTPYRFAPGIVPVYYDKGDLATGIWNWYVDPAVQVTLGNAVGAHLVTKGFTDWSAVATSSFRAQVVGDFGAIGLPDITGDNIDKVIGTFNGGGVDVIFDADGSVMEALGAPPGVLGISSPEFGIDGTSIITESWTILGGQAIDGRDTDGANFQGVATHEFGHSIGLAHTQTNGAAFFYGPWGEMPGPAGCSALPYDATVPMDDVETMYPYTDPGIGGTGPAQAHIHTTDDLAALSDLYPGPGWPLATGSIKGTIFDVDGKTPLTGVNVIARNLANPYADANSALSGEWTQGMFGPDGSFVLNGLRPGATYVIYTDAIFAGGFPTPPMWFLPGPERFYDGATTKKTTAFTSCEYQPITVHAGAAVTANIQFERIAGAPVIYNLGYGTFVSSLTADGSIAAGSYGRGTPIFRWSAKGGIKPLPDVFASDANVYISGNGQYMATNLVSAENVDLGSFRWDGKKGWQAVPSKAGSCGTDTTYTWGLADDGSVYGMAYKSCTDYQGFKWNPAAGLSLLPTATRKDDGSPSNSRPNAVSADGSTVVGWEESMVRLTLPDEWGGGAVDPWLGRVAASARSGQPTIVVNDRGDTMEEATAVSSDGKIIGGAQYFPEAPVGAGWLKNVESSELSFIGPLYDTSETWPNAVSKDGSLVAGFAGNAWFDLAAGPFICSKRMGMVDLNLFLKAQGANINTAGGNLWMPMAMSEDGATLGGWGYGNLANFGWVLQMPKVFVCHASGGTLHTISVSFPTGMDAHLAHGDTVGPCVNYQQ